jgi:O-antigen biosynthesis protein
MSSPQRKLDNIQETLKQAQELTEQGKMAEAIDEYRSLLEVDDHNIAALHQLAHLYESQKNFAGAIEHYRRAIELDPHPPFWVYRHFGFVLSQDKKLTEAVAAYQKAITLNPEDVSTYGLLGQAQGLKGDVEGAISSYQKQIELSSDLPVWVYLNLGEGLSQQERWEEAIEVYRKALALEPENAGIQHLLAAVTARKEASAIDPVAVAKRLQEEGKLEEALFEYRSVLEKDGSNLVALHQVAQICEGLGKWEEVVAGYRRAIEVDAESPWVYRHLGFALSQQERLEEAIEAYQRAIKLNPEDVETYSLLGKSLQRQGQLEKAIINYQKAIELNPKKNTTGVYVSLAQALSSRGEFSNAIEAYSIASQLEPANPDIYQLLAEAYARQGDLQNALASCDKAVEIRASSWHLYHYLGDILLNLKNWEEAIVCYQKSLEINPYFEWSYYNLGVCLDQQGKWQESVFAYRKALEYNPNLPSINEKIEKAFEKISSQLLPSKLELSKSLLETLNSTALENFLLSGSNLYFPEVEKPEVSIILILYNRAELTLSCLESILKNSFRSLEIIIVDNNSTDQTKSLLQQIRGATIILNEENLHFLLACNQASKVAKGKYLLFLNNDAQVLGNSIEIAVETLKSSPDIGSVGGKIILPDGTLQEAGSLIWQNGSCLGYGRGDAPTEPQYMFKRYVDYCSGAFLLTPRSLFVEMGGFDEDYKPAYYEETDYCVRLLRAGKKNVYEPRVAILHYEFASSNSSASSGKAIELQKRNQILFFEKHKTWFASQYEPAVRNIIFARSARHNQKRILFIEDKVPHTFLGSGYTRGNSILSKLVEMGFFVTIYPTDLLIKEDWRTVYSDIPREVEVMNGYTLPLLEKFLQERRGYYDIVFVSRPHNMEHLENVLKRENYLEHAKIIYDAEALYCLREIERRRLYGEKIVPEEIQTEIDKELKLARRSDCIVSVSENERRQFLEFGYQNVRVIGHSVEVCPTPNTFQERQNFLFVGAIYDLNSPNADSIMWLGGEIFSLIQSKMSEKVELTIAGTNMVEELKANVERLGNHSIQMVGRVDDLTDLYNRSRVFVVPTRFAAGIPHKAHEAAANGIPMVVTSLIANQLGWVNESDLLVADTAEEFARQCIRLYQDAQLWNKLRINALKKVKLDCSPDRFMATLREIFTDL